MPEKSRLVYSTDKGRIKTETKQPDLPQGDGIVRIRRETSGRKGKGVTTIDGLAMDSGELKATAKHLKQLCGTGGAVKNGIIEIQGDHREKIKSALEAQGHTVKLAGG
jgi:translation initiation factor 1